MVKQEALTSTIPEGRPKSGRVWKVKQKTRFSLQQRSGFLDNLNKSWEEKELIRKKKQQVLQLERDMKEEKRLKKIAERERREAQQKRRMENEYKNSVYQTVSIGIQFLIVILTYNYCIQIKPEKLKGMSKKQLRTIRKTAMNKNGQIELVNPWERK